MRSEELKVVLEALESFADRERAEQALRYFKCGPGEYGEGDLFLGIRVPEVRKLAKKFETLSLNEITELLHSKYHEARLLALFILVHLFEKANEDTRKKIYDLYLANTTYINNWDLVDSSAGYIVGRWLFDKDRSTLYSLAKSASLWERRIAVMATFYFIKEGEFDDTLAITEILLEDSHDLIHKAVGWMLREIGNIDRGLEEGFLKRHYKKMPRVMLRYAIEKFPEDLRQEYLQGTV